MLKRKSNLFLFYLFLNLLLLGLMFGHASYERNASLPSLGEKREMVQKLGLTDLCLFTDARYTRHPSMADLHTPFQDYPMSFEHFPSGSILRVPPHLSYSVSVSEERKSVSGGDDISRKKGNDGKNRDRKGTGGTS